MKISAADFSRFCHQKDSTLLSALFYGENEAFIQPKLHSFLSLSSPSHTLDELCELDLLQGNKSLRERLSTADLFRGPRVFLITHATDKLVPVLKELIEKASSKEFFVVQARDYLKPSSKLRKLYEEHEKLASIPCYAPDLRTLEAQTRTFFSQRHKKISPLVLKDLSLFFLQEPSILVSELEKIILYIGDKEEVSVEDLEHSLGSFISFDTEILSFSFLDKNVQVLSNHLTTCLNEGISPISILRNLIPHLIRLHEAHSLLATQKSLDQVMMMLKPPLFFTQKLKFQQHLKEWNRSLLQKVLEKLLKIEKECKLNSSISEEICQQSLVELIFKNSKKF